LVWGTLSLIVLFVLSLTLSSAFHLHNGTNEATCSICHLNHQAIDHSSVKQNQVSFEIVGVRFDSPDPETGTRPVISRLPARAPPLA
jgi:hypothetical protein